MPPGPLDILEEQVRIDAWPQVLQGVLAYPFAERPPRAALIVGPHPMMGGRLENNVVRAVGRGLAEHGFCTLRFRFSGDGPSPEVMDAFWRTGRAPDDPRRALDAQTALAWFRRVHGGPLVLVGYSFGASLLTGLCSRKCVSHIVMIGATLAQHDYRPIAECSLPKLLITADNDFATPLETTRNWFAAAREPKRLVLLEAAEHFYRGHEQRLVEEIVAWTTH